VTRNLAKDGQTSADLLASVEQDPAVRDAIAKADIVAIGIGGNDLNLGDAALEAGTCQGTSCYDAPIASYGANLGKIAAEVMRLRAGRPTILRALSMPNALTGAEDVIPPFLSRIATEIGAYQGQRFTDATCKAMSANGGVCVDLLAPFNGPDGTGDAYASGLMNHDDCCYPSEKGHQLIAQLLYATGLAPLVTP
jgi:hypothetical protein